MVAPAIAAAGIMAGAQLAAPMMGSLLNQGGRDDDAWWLAVQQYETQKKQFAENMAMQYDFAKNGLKWKVDDAVAAGLHPLAAIGAAGASSSPIQVGTVGYQPPERPYQDWAGAVRGAGQDIGRAVAATQTPEEKALAAIAQKRAAAEADFAQSQALMARRELLKPTATASFPSTFQFMVNEGGRIVKVPSSDYAQATAGNLFLHGENYLKDKISSLPFLNKAQGYPDTIQFEGQTYRYQPVLNEYMGPPGPRRR